MLNIAESVSPNFGSPIVIDCSILRRLKCPRFNYLCTEWSMIKNSEINSYDVLAFSFWKTKRNEKYSPNSDPEGTFNNVNTQKEYFLA